LVTGAGTGIGKMVAIGFVKEGAKVVIAENNFEAARDVVRQIKSTGGTAMAIKTDVTSRDDVSSAVEKAVIEFGNIHILVNNAGIIMPAMLNKMTDEQFSKVLDVHIKGSFICIQEVVHHMIKASYGKIINVTSAAGIAGTVGQINYSAAKGAIISLTKSAAKELSRYNITVNCVAPAAATKMTEFIRKDPKLGKLYLSKIPLGRWPEPHEVTPAFVFFASDDSSYVTGQVLNVDGGYMM
jgi:3-oxoacyl-[acyl-carrier protein] reductase